MYRQHIPPSLFAALGLIGGILYAHTGYLWIYIIAPCVLISVAIYGYLCVKKRLVYHINGNILLVFFTIGAWRYTEQQNYYSHTLDAMQGDTIDIISTVDDINNTAIAHQSQYRMQILRWKPTISQTWNPCDITIYLYSARNTNLEVSDKILVEEIILKQPRHDSYRQYLIKEGISGSTFKSLKNYTLLHRPHHSWKRWLWNIRYSIVEKISLKMNSMTAGLFTALFLGNTKQYPSESSDWSDLFRSWGISHYLARSGIHLTLFISLWFLILRSIPITLAIKQLLLLLLLCSYAAMSWPSISFYRALHSALLLVWSRLHKRNTHILHILATVCLVTLMYNPTCLLFLDFELSYGLTFALGWFNYLTK